MELFWVLCNTEFIANIHNSYLKLYHSPEKKKICESLGRHSEKIQWEKSRKRNRKSEVNPMKVCHVMEGVQQAKLRTQCNQWESINECWELKHHGNPWRFLFECRLTIIYASCRWIYQNFAKHKFVSFRSSDIPIFSDLVPFYSVAFSKAGDTFEMDESFDREQD